MSSFLTFDLRRAGVLWQDGELTLHALGREPLGLVEAAAYWVLVTEGEVQATVGTACFTLQAEHYLATPGIGVLQGGCALVIEQRGYRNVRQFGGPLEMTGRLRYVDGCSDTLLVCPPRLGEPCLSHLHIPPSTQQSVHSHPS